MKNVEDMNEDELREFAEGVLARSRDKALERLRMMDMVNQVTDPNVRLPIKYILENMK